MVELWAFVAGAFFAWPAAVWWRWVHGPELSRRTRVWLAAVITLLSPLGTWVAVEMLVYAIRDDHLPPPSLQALLPTSVYDLRSWVGFAIGLGAHLVVQGMVPKAAPPVADLHGRAEFELPSQSAGVSLALAAASVALVVPGVVLGAAPILRNGTRATIRVQGEVVEVRRGRRVSRVRLAGGTVSRAEDLFGTPSLVLRGSDGVVEVPVGGASAPEVDLALALIESATRATPTPEAAVPEALAAMRRRAGGVSE